MTVSVLPRVMTLATPGAANGTPQVVQGTGKGPAASAQGEAPSAITPTTRSRRASRHARSRSALQSSRVGTRNAARIMKNAIDT